MKKQKIVHVQVLPKITGVQQISYDILKGISDEFEKYIVFGSASDGVGGDIDLKEIERLFSSIDVSILYLPSLKREISLLDFKAVVDFYRLFKKYNFDIVHTNSTKPGVVARIAAKLAGVKKIIHTVHGISFHESNSVIKRFIYFFIEILSLPFGDYNITVNRFYLRYYPNFLTKNRAILNGVDFSRLNGSIGVNDSDVIKIGFFARLDEQKDPITFLKVAKDICFTKKLPKKTKFYLAGDGQLKQESLDYIQDNKLTGFVEVVGWVSDVSSFLSDMDIICQPSRWEAFGLNIVEAGYLGVPCVGSSVEGIPEVIVDGVTGFLCEPGSVVSFSNGLTRLIMDDSLRNDMSHNVKSYVIKNFDVSRMVSEYSNLYRL